MQSYNHKDNKKNITLSRVFLSYKYTGIPLHTIHELIDPIRDKIIQSGKEFVCNLYYDAYYKENDMNYDEILTHAISLSDSCNEYMIIVDNNAIGRGMMLEANHVKDMDLPMTLLFRGAVPAILRSMVDRIIEFKNVDDVIHQL